MLPESVRAITALVRERAGIVLDEGQAYMVETRLRPVLREAGLASLDSLAHRLGAVREDALRQAVIEALTTNESLFFRDGHPFDHLARLLPRLAADRPPGQPIRIWSAACAAGQEAYSVAMLAAEHAAALPGRAVRILGTDLSRAMVERARAGAFTRFEVQRGLTVQRLIRFFRQEGERFAVQDSLRAVAEFRQENLLALPPPAEAFDVVFCRNVLIYFDAPTKQRVLAAIAARMARDGVLYLGAAETVLGLTTAFAPIPGERGAYALPGSALSAAGGCRGSGSARPGSARNP